MRFQFLILIIILFVSTGHAQIPGHHRQQSALPDYYDSIEWIIMVQGDTIVMRNDVREITRIPNYDTIQWYHIDTPIHWNFIKRYNSQTIIVNKPLIVKRK